MLHEFVVPEILLHGLYNTLVQSTLKYLNGQEKLENNTFDCFSSIFRKICLSFLLKSVSKIWTTFHES